MNIYDILNEEEGEAYTKPEEIREAVEAALGDPFEPGASQWPDVKKKFGTFDKFVDKVIDVLTNGSVQYDDSWGGGEVYFNIENVGQDLLDGNPIGTSQNTFADVFGVDEDGRINCSFTVDISGDDDDAEPLPDADAEAVMESLGF